MNDKIVDPLSFAVKKLFGLSYLFPYQRLVIANILEAAQKTGLPVKFPQIGEKNPDIQICKNTQNEEKEAENAGESAGRQIVILPTGAGKSLCFQLPAMLIEGLTLVIYPILSLMSDQERRLKEKGFVPVILRGGQNKEERDEIWKKLTAPAEVSGEGCQTRFIITNPEVLLTAQVKEQLEKIKIVHVVIDEAHCVSEWGESFRPDYLKIASILEYLNPPLVTAFTATAGSGVLEKIKKYIFAGSNVLQITGNPDRSNISYSAKGCINRDLAVRDLLAENARPAIVFCSSRAGTEKLARYLQNEFAEMGCPRYREIRFYHAGLSKEEKDAAEKWFFDNPEAVLCATCAYGMGVDKPDVRTVIHRDCAPSAEAYLQETGRAGRDGKQSTAILLFGPEDERTKTRAKTGADALRVGVLLNYARDTENCRRHSLLALLNYDGAGEVPEKLCCDVCENTANAGIREELPVMDFFRKNKRRYTADEAALILSGSKNIRWSEGDASAVIFHLINSGKLKKAKYFPWKNRITV